MNIYTHLCVRYFTAFIYEFQFYRELCLASGGWTRKEGH